jgi:hypothetical protein
VDRLACLKESDSTIGLEQARGTCTYSQGDTTNKADRDGSHSQERDQSKRRKRNLARLAMSHQDCGENKFWRVLGEEAVAQFGLLPRTPHP